MSLILQAKRAAKDSGLYRGEVESLNWEPSHVVMWSRLCDKYGGVFTNEPTRAHQSHTFLEFIDKYKDPEYTASSNPGRQSNEAKLAGGRNLKDFIPDNQPINTNLPENISKLDAKKELQNRNQEVNKNANVQLPSSMQPPKQNRLTVPSPKKIVEQENANNTREVFEHELEHSVQRFGEVTGKLKAPNDSKCTINETGEVGEVGEPVLDTDRTNANQRTNESNSSNSSVRESKATPPSTNSSSIAGKTTPKHGASTASPAGQVVKVR